MDVKLTSVTVHYENAFSGQVNLEIQVEMNKGISLVTEYLESQPLANLAILPQQLPHQSQAFIILHFCT